jgi:antitoxin ParD1/3/4
MTITLELSPELRANLLTNLAHRDSKGIRQLLAEAFAPTVESLLKQTYTHADDMSEEEFEALADLLADEFAASVKPNMPPLSDYAVSRAGIYEEHP